MSEVKRFRKKPVEIEAMQWTGGNVDDCYGWAVAASDGPIKHAVVPCFFALDDDEVFDVLPQDMIDNFVTVRGATAVLWVAANSSWLPILTGEWIAKDRHGFYPIKADVFAESYEEVQ